MQIQQCPFLHQANQIGTSFWGRRDLALRNLCDGDLFMPSCPLIPSCFPVSMSIICSGNWGSPSTPASAPPNYGPWLCIHLWSSMHHRNLFFFLPNCNHLSPFRSCLYAIPEQKGLVGLGEVWYGTCELMHTASFALIMQLKVEKKSSTHNSLD